MDVSAPAVAVHTWGQSRVLMVSVTEAGGAVQGRVRASEGQPRLATKKIN